MKDEANPRKEQRAIQSVEVGGPLLLALADHPMPMTLKDLAAAVGLSPSRAHPYLVSFGKLGLVEQDRASGRYALGPAALQIGLSCLHQSDPLKAATPHAEALAAELEHAVAIAVWGNFGPTVVRLIEGRQPLHVNLRAGAVMSVLGTATGRAFAAVLPRATLDAAIASQAGGAAPPGKATITREVREAAAELAEHGVARAMGRPIPGINAFSAPVFDHEGRAALVLTSLGPADSFAADWRSPCAVAVRRAAEQVSRRLGHRR